MVYTEVFKNGVMSFLDLSGTATGRATHYNTLEEQRQAVEHAHDVIFASHRGLYGLIMSLPGVTHFTRQAGIVKLLSNPFSIYEHDPENVLPVDNPEQAEGRVIEWLINSLPPQRVFNTFLKLAELRVNNSRTRRMILKYLYNSDKLELWAVKYRRKIRGILTHCYGEKEAGILRSILEKARPNAKELVITKDLLIKYLDNEPKISKLKLCVSFILGNDVRSTAVPLITAFGNAKEDLEQGKRLPMEVLEGIRSTYHPEVPAAKVLELTKASMTKTQRKNVQASAAKKGVRVEWDPSSMSAIELYIYAFERGMTDEIEQALDKRAEEAANALLAPRQHAGLVLDKSLSMSGHRTQKLRPMAIALALRDMLRVKYDLVTDRANFERLIRPSGYTDLAGDLAELLNRDVEVIFIITDGYENVAAGRANEVINLARKCGITTAVQQFVPVAAAEAKGVRALSPDINVSPISDPAGLGLGLIRTVLEVNFEEGIKQLIDATIEVAGGQREVVSQ